jgi:hypothetical protein
MSAVRTRAPGFWSRASSIPAAWAWALLLLLALLCALVLLWIPRPVEPDEMPGLRLPVAEVSRVLRRDQAAVSVSLPRQESSRLERLYLDQGRYERAGVRPPEAGLRLKELRRRLRRFGKKQGEEAMVALRARAVARLRSALDIELDEKQTLGVLGSFPKTLRTFGASRDGELVAPWFVVRTLYKARWNLVHGLVPTEGMERVELLAYYGWLALQAEEAPLDMRVRALALYASLGGADAEEAQGVLSYRIGDLAAAERHLQAAYQQRPGLRLRNYLLAVRRVRGG